MLGFAETSANSRDMAGAAEFERDNDDVEYESKVSKLLKGVYKRDVEAGMKPDWDSCLDDLAEQDIYLSVMLEKAGIKGGSPFSMLSDWRFYWGLLPTIFFVAAAAVLAFTPLAARLIPNGFLRLGLTIVMLLAPLLMNKMGGGRTD